MEDNLQNAKTQTMVEMKKTDKIQNMNKKQNRDKRLKKLKRNQIQNKNIEYHSTQNNEYITAPTHQRYEHILAVPVYLPVLRRNIRT